MVELQSWRFDTVLSRGKSFPFAQPGRLAGASLPFPEVGLFAKQRLSECVEKRVREDRSMSSIYQSSCRQARAAIPLYRHGFTMLEMAAVLAIIAILAIIAVPGFQDRIIRDQIVSAVPLADIVKAPIALSWATVQALPADNAAAGLPPAEKIVNNYINSISVHDGAIDITFGNSANGLIKGRILTIRPAIVADAPIVPVAWICGNADGPGQMTVKGENRTDIPANYLPLNCRAPGR
jgi:type IV pilus assembly protein PilA